MLASMARRTSPVLTIFASAASKSGSRPMQAPAFDQPT